jgi:hypothetical protein
LSGGERDRAYGSSLNSKVRDAQHHIIIPLDGMEMRRRMLSIALFNSNAMWPSGDSRHRVA